MNTLLRRPARSLTTTRATRRPRLRTIVTAATAALLIGAAGEAHARPTSWLNPVCSTEGLESPVDTCDGPWAYDWSRKCSDPGICDYSSTCQTARACGSYQNGIQKSPVTLSPATTYTYSCTTISTPPGYEDASVSCGTPTPQQRCSSLATSQRASILAGVPSNAPGYSQWLSLFQVQGLVSIVSQNTTYSGGSYGKPLREVEKTTYRCQLSVPNHPSPAVAPNLAVCGCQEFKPNTCVCETGTTVTEPSPDAPRPTSPGPGLGFTTKPRCLTCDDPDFDVRSDDPSSMLACLLDGLEGASTELHGALVARLKLLMQLAGDQLDPAERASLLEALDESGAPACHMTLAQDPACAATQGDPAQAAITAQLQLCADLRGSHVPRDVVRGEMSTCVATLAAIAQLPPGACRESLRDVGSDVVSALIERSTSGYQRASLETDLVETLTYLDAWYGAVAGQADAAWRQGRASALTGAIWRRAHEAALELPVSLGSDAAAAALLGDVASAGLEVDGAMLRAAFHPSHPLSSPPLLYVVGDALRGTSERLAQVSPVHDVACQFAGCAPAAPGAPPRSTPASDAWRVLASLDDQAALGQALARATALAGQHPELVASLGALRDRHDQLALAWKVAAGAQPLAALADPAAGVPVEAEGLAAIVRAARTASQSYAATGLLDASPPRLSSAVLRREQLVGFLNTSINQLDGAVSGYSAARLDTVNDLLAQTRAAGQTQSVTQQTVAAAHRMRDLVGQLGGLRAREASEREALGQLTGAFEQVIASGALDTDAAYQVNTHPPLRIYPADARFPLNGTFDLPAIRASVTTLGVGEILRVRMPDATWAPTCALGISQVASPTGVPANITLGPAVAGPEGYYLSWANTHYEARGQTDTESSVTSVTESLETCLGASLTGSASMSPLAVSASVKACTSVSHGHSSTSASTSSNGNDSRFTASFNAGLRLPIVPVPSAPVGSLLAVLTVHDQPAHIIDVRVVGREDAIVAPALDPAVGTQVDVHFLVNDVTTPGCGEPSGDSLLLEMSTTRPLGLVAHTVGVAMSQAIEEMEAKAPAILAQGGLTGGDQGELRAGAWARLTTLLAAQGVGLQGLPVELRNLFEAWIEKSIASLHRRAEVDRVQRQIAQLNLEMQGLNHELSNTAAQSRLLSLIPRWRLRALAGTHLRPAIDALGESLTAYTAPLFELRDPARLSGFRTTAAGQLTPLLNVDFAASLDAVGDDLGQFATSARNSLTAAEFDLPATARRTVVLAFPRTPDACDMGVCDQFRQASGQASELLWRGIEGGGHVADLVVQPSDLYSPGGGNAQLSCHDLAPVVRRASVYLLNWQDTGTDFAAIGRELPAVAGEGGASFLYPRAGSALRFSADTEAGVPLSLPVINGPGGDVLTDFGASETLGVGAGVSPFSTFSVDFSSFYTSQPLGFLDATSAVLLVLEVERRVSTDECLVPGVCQP